MFVFVLKYKVIICIYNLKKLKNICINYYNKDKFV